VLRALERDRAPLSVRELARRAGEHLRSAQVAVARLSEQGLVERVGSGPQQLIQWNPRHPLAAALSALFVAERQRSDRILEQLAQLARRHAQAADFVWMYEHESTLRIGILGHSGDIDSQVDAFRQALVPLMRDEMLVIEVQGWTAADLTTAGVNPAGESTSSVIPLWGVMPAQWNASKKSFERRSHQQIDAELKERATRLAALVQSRPELLRLAKEEVERELQRADAFAAKNLREWSQILEAMVPSTFARWLTSDGEQALRLRQSLPLIFLRALDAATEVKQSRAPSSARLGRRKTRQIGELDPRYGE
jgi:hypothetical protein